MRRPTTIILLFSYFFVHGQNIVTNPDFELFTTCPTSFSQLNAIGWDFASPIGSSDYFHTCGAAVVGVPSNFAGFQDSQSGNAYVGFATYGPIEYREYVQSTLVSPTIPGCYEIEIRYSLGEEESSSNNLGVALTNGPPSTLIGTPTQLNIIPVQTDKTIWYTEIVNYISPGGETTITIGNFYDNASTTFVNNAGVANPDFAYYYVDFVRVEFVGTNTGNINVDLGPDIYICENQFPVTLTSNQPSNTNIWSTGESGTSIQVNSEGEYIVQSFANCEFGVDTIEVFITPEPSFELNDTILCFGSNYLVQLDPSLGTYTLPDGSMGTQYLIMQEGNYNFILDYNCIINQEINVVYHNPIVIPDIPDQEICEDELPLLINLFSINDGINEFLWSNNSIDPNIVINQEGIYSVQVSNTCFSDMDEFIVDTDPVLPATIPLNNSISCDNQPIQIATGLFDADLVWQDGSTETFFIAPGPGDYSVTATNFCGTEVYNFIIYGGSTDPVSLGADVALCPGDSVLISSSNGGVLNWNTGVNAESIWVSTAQEVIAVSSNVCGTSMDTINVTLNGAAPVLSLPDTLAICQGDTIGVQATMSSGGIDFVWDHGPTSNQIELYQGGTYYVEGSNNCGVSSDSIFVTVGEALAVVDIDSLTQICPGDTAFFAINQGNSDLIWSDGTMLGELEITSPGIFWIELSNSCAITIDTFEVEFLPELPPIDLGPDQDVCQGDSLVLSDPNLSNTSLWNDGTLADQLTVYAAGTYSVISSNSCNEVTDTLIVNDLGQSPDVSLGNDFLICTGDTIDLMASGNFNDILWDNSSIGVSQEITGPGTYMVTVSNDCGISYDTLIVGLNQQAPSVDLGDDQFFCPGDSVLLDIGNVAGDISWSNNGSEASSIYVFSEGEVIVNVTSACGTAIDTVTLSLWEALPPLDLTIDTLLCNGEVLDLNLTLPSSVTILWDNGSNASSQTINQAGTYWVEISNNCGVERDSIIVAYVAPLPNFTLPEDLTICDNNSYTIFPDPQVDLLTYLWSDGSSADSLLVTQSGNYQLQISNACESNMDAVQVTFGELVAPFNFDVSDTICSGQSILLEGDQGDQFTYLWQDGSSDTNFDADQNGVYTLEVSSICNTETASLDLNILPDPDFNVDLENIYRVCEGTPVEIVIPQSAVFNILWDDGSSDNTKSISEAGSYGLSLSNACRDSLINFIVEIEDCTDESIYVPTIFSPNQDGFNEFFSLHFSSDIDVTAAQVRIFDRWGELVFSSDDPEFSWDGRFKNQRLNPAVFVYVIDLEYLVNDQIESTSLIGDITLVR